MKRLRCWSSPATPPQSMLRFHREFITAAARLMMAAKLVSVLSARMAMRLNSLSLQKKFSIKWRHLYISPSSGWERARRGCCEITILAPRAFRSAMHGVDVEGFVGDQRAEGQAVDERRHADRVKALAKQQDEAREIAESVGEGQDFGGHAAFGAADGLALSLPFEPCPWRWTLTMVASTRAYSISGSSEQASKSRTKTSALTQSRYHLNTVFQRPNAAGRSRHGLPVRTIHNTASRKSRLSPPLRPGSVGLPRRGAPSSTIGRQSKQIDPSAA